MTFELTNLYLRHKRLFQRIPGIEPPSKIVLKLLEFSFNFHIPRSTPVSAAWKADV